MMMTQDDRGDLDDGHCGADRGVRRWCINRRATVISSRPPGAARGVEPHAGRKPSFRVIASWKPAPTAGSSPSSWRPAPAITSPRPRSPRPTPVTVTPAKRPDLAPRLGSGPSAMARTECLRSTRPPGSCARRSVPTGNRTTITCGWIVMQDGELAQEGPGRPLRGFKLHPILSSISRPTFGDSNEPDLRL